MPYNVFVYLGKLRVWGRGFSAGKSELANGQRPNGLTKISNVFYTVLNESSLPVGSFVGFKIHFS
jgi:hypothetical protein